MAQQIGPIRLRGKMGGISFSCNGQAKIPPGPRSITAQRTQENALEFGRAARTSKIIRQALSPLEVAPPDLHNRLTSLIRQKAFQLDTASPRGQRFLSRNAAVTLLAGFDFNSASPFEAIFPGKVTIDQSGTSLKNIQGNNFTGEDIKAPTGATHVQVRTVVAGITSTAEEIAITTDPVIGSSAEIPLDATEITFASNPGVAATDPNGNVFNIAGISFKFYQQVATRFYRLENGIYDVGKIIFVG